MVHVIQLYDVGMVQFGQALELVDDGFDINRAQTFFLQYFYCSNFLITFRNCFKHFSKASRAYFLLEEIVLLD